MSLLGPYLFPFTPSVPRCPDSSNETINPTFKGSIEPIELPETYLHDCKCTYWTRFCPVNCTGKCDLGGTVSLKPNFLSVSPLLHSSNYYGSYSCLWVLSPLGMRKCDTASKTDGPIMLMLTCTAKGSWVTLLSSCYLALPVSAQMVVFVPLASMFKPRTEMKPMLCSFLVSLCSHVLSPGQLWSGIRLGTTKVMSFSKSATQLENNHCKKSTWILF